MLAARVTFFTGGVRMATSLTKAEVVEKLAKAADLPKSKTAQVLDELADLAYKQAKNGFTIPGIGKMVVTKRKARMGRNPQTGKAIKIPAGKVLKMRFAKAAKDAVK
jgi:DNA-binding protein HU-beta